MNYITTQLDRVGGIIDLDLGMLNDYIEKKCGGIEYFFGCWSPEEVLLPNLNLDDNIQCEKGKNWFVLRNGANRTSGLIFPGQTSNEPDLTIFRGYLGEQALHTYSDPLRVKEYWSINPDRRHNGIFATVIISENGEKLTFVTDIFGISPLFIRKVGNHIFYSNVASLLAMKDDEPDVMSWVMRFLLGSVPGDNSLIKSVKKLPPASVTSFSGKDKNQSFWYGSDKLPRAETPYSDLVLEEAYEYLNRAVDRGINLNYGERMLPLSAGYDSRRLFGYLNQKNVNFRTCTVQMPGKWGEDSDAVFGKKIADDFGVEHFMVKMNDKESWHNNHLQRNNSFSGLADSHAWSVALFNKLHDFKGCFYDGLGGDVFVCQPEDTDVLTIELKPNSPLGFLNKKFTPTLEEIRKNFENLYFDKLDGVNNSIITYLLWQSRNMTAMWAQNQTRPGQLTICPFLDLEYIEKMLSFSGEGQPDGEVPRKMLEKFWPELASYPTSHNPPENIGSVKNIRQQVEDFSYKKYLEYMDEVSSHELKIDDILSVKGKVIFFLARYLKSIRKKQLWWTGQLPHLIKWWHSKPKFYSVKKQDDD